jgi:hydroxymethylpyrimidine pyrophosphatase-like HAD family hydrolase
MRFRALATDFDGTLAHHGVVDDSTLAALQRAKSSGRKLVLVTGREVDEIVRIFPALGIFDSAVVENGAAILEPVRGRVRLLGAAPPEAFFERLRSRGVPIARGRVIASTVEPHQEALRETIRELGLDLQIVLNKGSVMALPSDVSKASGLAVAANELGLQPRAIVGIGDAENDDAFLNACGLGVAVANALPSLKSIADHTTRGRAGAGVAEFIDEHLLEDCARIAVKRQKIEQGGGE